MPKKITWTEVRTAHDAYEVAKKENQTRAHLANAFRSALCSYALQVADELEAERQREQQERANKTLFNADRGAHVCQS